jgi:hypothetical protein
VDTDEVRFFGDNELPELSISRVTKPQVSRFFEQYRDPNRPADFDQYQPRMATSRELDANGLVHLSRSSRRTSTDLHPV